MFIAHDDAQFYTVDFGNSPRTLVGMGGWAGSWELWLEPFSLLSSTWRTVAYDHRGVGATIALTESITVERMVNDVFVVLDALKIEQCVLAAESAGAAIAILAALQQPERFNGLVLVDGLYYQPKTEKPSPFLLGLQHQFEATIGAFVDQCVPETGAEADAIRRWGRQILARSPQDAAIRLYEIMLGIDLRADLSKIVQPTLILHGEKDVIVPVESSQWMASQIPQCHLQIIEGTGHVPTVTRPREVAAAINAYFESIL